LPLFAEPKSWPQRPLLIIPTSNTSTRILGVRFIGEKCYLPPDKCENVPINTGSEAKGQSLVVDFSSDAFMGTMLVRIKDSKPLLDDVEPDQKSNYFDNRHRTFQVTVRGRFRQSYPMTSSVTGQVFHPITNDHKPNKTIINGAIRLFKYLSPQLEVQWDHSFIKFLSPLNSTAQSIHVTNNTGDETIIEDWHLTEPECHQSTSILHDLPSLKTKHTKTFPQKYRKQVFDSLATAAHHHHIKSPTLNCFDPNKTYTFQFYQHLLFLQDYSLDLGKMLGGKWKLTKILSGQPIKIMAGFSYPNNDMNYFWSFTKIILA